MPIYEYKCEGCALEFESFESMSNRDGPLSEPCPECGESRVKKLVSVTTMGVDMNVTPDSKTGGDWSRMMDKIKNGLPERHHGGIDRSTSRTGGRLGPQ
jgi:putative FmdB family regulatory protein